MNITQKAAQQLKDNGAVTINDSSIAKQLGGFLRAKGAEDAGDRSLAITNKKGQRFLFTYTVIKKGRRNAWRFSMTKEEEVTA